MGRVLSSTPNLVHLFEAAARTIPSVVVPIHAGICAFKVWPAQTLMAGMLFNAVVPCSVQGESGDPKFAEMQHHQVRELLAKQSKQRQSKKRQQEEEKIMREGGGQVPLRHWPEEGAGGSGAGGAQQYPSPGG